MKKHLLVFVLLSMLFLVACGNSGPQPNAPQPDDTQTEEPADEPEQPTLSQMSALGVATALQQSGLPIDYIVEYDEQTDPSENLGRPNQYIQKVSFADTRLEQYDVSDPIGGTVEVFNNAEDAQTHYDSVEAAGKEMPSTGYYLYLYDNILLRVTFDLTPTQATEYQAAFEALIENK